MAHVRWGRRELDELPQGRGGDVAGDPDDRAVLRGYGLRQRGPRAAALRKGMTLQACQRATQGMSFGSTDCAKSMTWAMAQKKAFDVFVVYAAAPWW
jgi:hypothetical protein